MSVPIPRCSRLAVIPGSRRGQLWQRLAEAKAVIMLLSLLYLGVKNVRPGPTLFAFLSPGVAKGVAENFDITGIGTVEDAIKLF